MRGCSRPVISYIRLYADILYSSICAPHSVFALQRHPDVSAARTLLIGGSFVFSSTAIADQVAPSSRGETAIADTCVSGVSGGMNWVVCMGVKGGPGVKWWCESGPRKRVFEWGDCNLEHLWRGRWLWWWPRVPWGRAVQIPRWGSGEGLDGSGSGGGSKQGALRSRL